MPIKASGPATDYREIDRSDTGVGWIAHPAEKMQRASHALVVDDEVWVCDPVDATGIDDLLAEFGDVAGVVTLLDRHKRDAAAIANRHDVSVHIPTYFDGVADSLDAPIERFREELTDGVRVHTIVDSMFWKEAALYVEDREELIVPESLGTTDYFLAAGERLGVHPFRRLTPPTGLRQFSPDRIRVGHGPGIDENASRALTDALSGTRLRTPGLYLKNAKNLVLD